jgi:hypothetical protein
MAISPIPLHMEHSDPLAFVPRPIHIGQRLLVGIVRKLIIYCCTPNTELVSFCCNEVNQMWF